MISELLNLLYSRLVMRTRLKDLQGAVISGAFTIILCEKWLNWPRELCMRDACTAFFFDAPG